MQNVIEVAAPDGSLTSIVVTIGLVIGRDGDVVVADPSISRRHAFIGPGGDGALVVTDLGSSNGCLLNGVRIRGSATLRDGDRLILGDTVVLVRAIDGGAPSGEPRVRPERGRGDAITS